MSPRLRWRTAPCGLALAAALQPVACSPSPPTPAFDLDQVLRPLAVRHPEVFADPAAYRFQLLLGVPVERGGETVLERRGFRVDAEYFYPASAIKTCAAVAALELLEGLQERGVAVDETTTLVFHPLFEDEVLEDRDPSNLETGAITVGHEVRKLFLVSDNRAFNRLFGLAGRRAVNEAMWRAGLDSVRVRHRLDEPRTAEQNRGSPRVDLVPTGGAVTLGERLDDEMEANDQPGLVAGRAHLRDGERIDEPFDFTFKNRISLADLQDLDVLVLRPDLLPDRPAFRISGSRLDLIRRAMGELPRESANPVYSDSEFPDGFTKFLLPGLRRLVPADRLRVYGKTGRAYGFTVENSYVVDERTGRSFFLTAVLYTNPNQTLNDDDYAYEELADPFFADLAEVAAEALLR